LVYCIQTAEDIVKLLSRPDSTVILFLTPSAGTQFRLQPGRKIHTGWKNFAIFN